MSIIGNQKIQNFLNKTRKKGLISQSYIFSGPESVGKFSLAGELASKLTGDTSFSENSINPDILVVAPEIEEKKGKIRKKSIGIEKIREIQSWLSTTSQLGRYKVVIIDEGEKMRVAAQNGLLKTLEDTPEKAVLIIITKKIENLLPTIISRSQVKKFSLVSREDISKMIPENHPQKEEIILWSMGRPGRTRKMLENESLISEAKKDQEDFLKLLEAPFSEKMEKAEEFGKDSQLFLEKVSVWNFILRQAMLGQKGGMGMGQKKAFLILEKIRKSLQMTEETNANTRLVLENLFLSF